MILSIGEMLYLMEIFIGLENKERGKKVNEFLNDYDYEDNPHYALIKDIEKGKIRVPCVT